MGTQYHVNRSKAKLSQRSEKYVYAAADYYYNNNKDNNINMHSIGIFKHKDKLYEVSVRIDELNPKKCPRDSNNNNKTSLLHLLDEINKWLLR